MNTTTSPTIVVVGTYPPYEDGISTFTHDLVSAQRMLFEPNIAIKVAAIDITGIDPTEYPAEVEWIVRKNERADYAMLADMINVRPEIACVIIQHEYGIFGGVLGEWTGDFILDLIDRLEKPIVIVCHTVLSSPPPEVAEVTKRFTERAAALVVMSRHSFDVLHERYAVPREKITVIPHGVHPTSFEYPEQVRRREGIGDTRVLATFGFLGPHKGIEYVIESLPAVVAEFPNTEYWLIGRTHPLIQAADGEAYRDDLEALVRRLKMERHVKFFNRYQQVPEILKFLSMTDVYIATSLSPEQTVSGTFSYALGSGRCIVSTAFAQAKESIVRRNMGLLVDFKKPAEFSAAILQILGNERARHGMQQRAYRSTRSMVWTNCAVSYVGLCADVDTTSELANAFLPVLNLAHVQRLTDDFGMIQFSKNAVPDLNTGYTIDDNARALLYCVEQGLSTDPTLLPLAHIYLRFIAHCQTPNGFFHNDVDADRALIPAPSGDQSIPEDANGRTLWALNVVRAHPDVPEALREHAESLVQCFDATGYTLSSVRARAFYVLGLVALAAHTDNPPELRWRRIIAEADALVAQFRENATDDWQWFEQSLTYANGIIPAALLKSFAIVNRSEYREIGLLSLEHLIKITFHGEVYVPIGQRGWYLRNKRRSEFDQQPEDPLAMIYALAAAYRLTGASRYLDYAVRAFTWFLGNNVLGEPLYDRTTGGCHDGLRRTDTNPNQGAESTLSYLLARVEIQKLLTETRSSGIRAFRTRDRS